MSIHAVQTQIHAAQTCLFTDRTACGKQAPSTLHSNVNKPYKLTYSTPNLKVHNGELTSLCSMGSIPEQALFVRSVFPIETNRISTEFVWKSTLLIEVPLLHNL